MFLFTVLQKGIKMKSSKESGINCPLSYIIEVTWANYGLYTSDTRNGETVIPLPLRYFTAKKTCTNNATSLMRKKCDGRTSCTVLVSDKTFLSQPDCYGKKTVDRYLVVRFRCKPHTKPSKC